MIDFIQFKNNYFDILPYLHNMLKPRLSPKVWAFLTIDKENAAKYTRCVGFTQARGLDRSQKLWYH